MARFADALESNPAPQALGDVTLRYEPSMLIGETPKGKPTWRTSATWVAGLSFLLFAAGALILQWDVWVVGLLLGLGAAAIGFAAWLERFEKRQRRFVANFGTVSLRLDFNSPIAGQPRTIVVPFDAVRATELRATGRWRVMLVRRLRARGRRCCERCWSRTSPTSSSPTLRGWSGCCGGRSAWAARPPTVPSSTVIRVRPIPPSTGRLQVSSEPRSQAQVARRVLNPTHGGSPCVPNSSPSPP